MVMKLMIVLMMFTYQNNDEIDKLNKRLIGNKINNIRMKEKLIIQDQKVKRAKIRDKDHSIA